MPAVSLAVDVHGGDYGPRVVLEGILEARKNVTVPLTIYLCGDEKVIIPTIDALSGVKGFCDKNSDCVVIHGSPLAGEEKVPSRVWRSKKDASIIRCISLQQEGVVDASLSAGDTRILIAASVFLLGRSRGIVRPALAALLPTVSSRQTLLLDVGANLECRTEHLVGFGLMGYTYSKYFFSIDTPSVALLNVGQESTKGTSTIVDAARILAARCNGFCGYIEGGRVLSGDADVIVCDGFTGNALLKACESFHTLTESVLKDNRKLTDAIKKKMAILNPDQYGAVQFLGLKGIVLKAHGSSSSRAVAQALLSAVRTVQQKECVHTVYE